MMYSHYQSYNQAGGGMAVASHQQALSWNGNEWVQTSGHVGSSTHSTYSSTGSQVNDAYSNNDDNPVFRYTKYYHDWKAREAEEERKMNTLPEGNLKQEAVRHVAWAKYYADQASRAAHYYNNPQGPIPELPPAPPSTLTFSTSSSLQNTEKKQTAAAETKNDTKKPSPGNLKRYVHRCLERCKGKGEGDLQWMQKEVQDIIGKALKDGTMHKIDWDEKELIPMKNEVSSVGDVVRVEIKEVSLKPHMQQQPKEKEQVLKQNVKTSMSEIKKDKSLTKYGNYIGKNKVSSEVSSYYGPSSLNDSYSKHLPKNNSYYGRTESKSKVPEKCNNSSQSVQKKKRGNQWVNEKGMNPSFVKDAVKKRCLERSHYGFQKNDIALDNRVKRFGSKTNHAKACNRVASNDIDKYMGKGLIGGLSKLDKNDYENMTVKGTCQVLEKEYLRLTAPPKAERVRPQPVMESHLKNLIKERASATVSRDYSWFCSQLKAIRQDLTVQRIFNNFAVLVYETHARIALQETDLNEYNQCQTQLKELYTSLSGCQKALVNQNEFIAYRLIYYVFLLGNKKYEGGSSDLFDIMLSLTPEQRKHPMIDYALKVRSAVADANYHLFFRLQKSALSPSMVFLMDHLVPSVRFWSLQRICKAYRPSVSAEFVLLELGFAKDEQELALKWLESCGCVLSKDRKILQTKDCIVHESDLKKQNSLI